MEDEEGETEETVEIGEEKVKIRNRKERRGEKGWMTLTDSPLKLSSVENQPIRGALGTVPSKCWGHVCVPWLIGGQISTLCSWPNKIEKNVMK